MENTNAVTKQVAKLINAKITTLKKQGVVGMGSSHLYMIVPTRTLTCSVPAYREAFAAALKTINRKGFEILPGALEFTSVDNF